MASNTWSQLSAQAGTTRLQRSVKVWLSPKQVRPAGIDDRVFWCWIVPMACTNVLLKNLMACCRLWRVKFLVCLLPVCWRELLVRVLRQHREQVQQIDRGGQGS